MICSPSKKTIPLASSIIASTHQAITMKEMARSVETSKKCPPQQQQNEHRELQQQPQEKTMPASQSQPQRSNNNFRQTTKQLRFCPPPHLRLGPRVPMETLSSSSNSRIDSRSSVSSVNSSRKASNKKRKEAPTANMNNKRTESSTAAELDFNNNISNKKRMGVLASKRISSSSSSSSSCNNLNINKRKGAPTFELDSNSNKRKGEASAKMIIKSGSSSSSSSSINKRKGATPTELDRNNNSGTGKEPEVPTAEWKQPPAGTRLEPKWLQEDNHKLVTAAAYYDTTKISSWIFIAQQIMFHNFRSAEECRARFAMFLQQTPTKRKSKRSWSKEDDKSLQDSVKQHFVSSQSWETIASELGGSRSAEACKTRWHKIKEGGNTRGYGWSTAEMATLQGHLDSITFGIDDDDLINNKLVKLTPGRSRMTIQRKMTEMRIGKAIKEAEEARQQQYHHPWWY